jgi:hypothetical protein
MDARNICLGTMVTVALCGCAHYRWMNDRISPQVAQRYLSTDLNECDEFGWQTVMNWPSFRNREGLGAAEASETHFVAERSCMADRGWTYRAVQVAMPSKATLGGS